MCKTKSIFKHDTFVDFTGATRNFCIAAVSQEENTALLLAVNELTEKTEVALPTKSLRIGVSICHPSDVTKYSKELAETIAEGKALKDSSAVGQIYSTDRGFINTKVVNALLEQEAEFFKQNPDRYITGYRKQKESYLKSKA